MDFESLKQAMNSNQFVQGGVALGIVGGVIASLIAFLKGIPGKIWGFIDRYLFLTLTYDDFDSSVHLWMVSWLAIKFKEKNQKNFSPIRNDNDDGFSLVPGYGWYYFRHKWKPGWITLTKKEGNGNSALQIKKIITVKILFGTRKDAEELVAISKKCFYPPSNEVYAFVNSGEVWCIQGAVRKVRPEHYIYPDGLLEKVIETVKTFKESKQWYEERGIPHRLTILLHGSAGTGKTSLVKVIASVFGLNIYILNLNSTHDKSLMELLTNTESRSSLILVEDIDGCAATHERKPRIKVPQLKKDEKSSAPTMAFDMTGLTISGILNAFDGVLSQDERIVFMTTNYPEKLDSALMRPGRIDIKIEIPNPDFGQFIRMVSKFYEDTSVFQNQNNAYIPISAATIQQTCLENRDSAQAALKAFKQEWQKARKKLKKG